MFNVTSPLILVALLNGYMRAHFVQPGAYNTDSKLYVLPPAVIYESLMHNYYHPVNHYLATVLDTRCEATLQIDDEITYHDQSQFSLKKIGMGYHQLYVYGTTCDPTLQSWIYNMTEEIQVREYNFGGYEEISV